MFGRSVATSDLLAAANVRFVVATKLQRSGLELAGFLRIGIAKPDGLCSYHAVCKRQKLFD